MPEWICDKAIRWRWPLLIVAIVITAVAIPVSRSVEFDRSIENMFSPDDPLLPPYKKLKDTFGGNEVVLGVYEDEQLMDVEGGGIDRLRRVTERLRKVEGVAGVLSLSKINDTLRKSPLGSLNFSRFRGPPILNPRGIAKRYRKVFEGYTHDAEGKVAAVACMLKSETDSSISRRETVLKLREVMETPQDGRRSGMIAGEPVMVVDGFRYVEADGRRLGWASTILLAITIIACFRSLRWVLIPIAVVQLSMLVTRAILVWSGLRLSMVSSMLTAIVTVVGVATVVHIIVRFRHQRMSGANPRQALLQSGRLLIGPIFWACCTDAIGFASLMIASVGPVHDFGIMMAVGSLTVFVCVGLLIPGMALIGRWDPDPKRVWGEQRLESILSGLVRCVESAPGVLATVVLVVVFGLAIGITRLDVETDFTKNFRETSPVVVSYQFVEERLGGAGVWDIIIPAPQRLNRKYVKRVATMQTKLRDLKTSTGEPALTKVISLVDGIQAADPNALLPEVPAKLMRSSMTTFVDALRTHQPPDGRHFMRIMLRARERQPADDKQVLIEKVGSIVRESFGDEERPAEVTGFFVLLTNLIKSMIHDQWMCFGAATLGIGLTMWLAFGSLRLALIALVPNAMPIFMVLGGMGWLGLKINMGAAMIAAVSMGLSIDSSIHYITSFQRAIGNKESLHQALNAVHQTVGRAMFFSTLALIVGFSVLCLSEFVPTIYFGALVSLSMLGGLFGNLLVLPLLLSATHRFESGAAP